MAEATDYESAYEGEQMDEAFGRILGMRIGREQITAQGDGEGAAMVYLGEGYGNHAFFASARCTSIDGNVGIINASVNYSASTGNATIRIDGDGVLYGETYAVDYLLIEMTEGA